MPNQPLLFLPGTLCTGSVFDAQRDALTGFSGNICTAEFRRERSIREMADSAAQLIPEGSRAAVAGFSMGGMVAIELAARHPSKVDRIALLNSNSHADLADRHAGRMEALEAARKHGLRTVVRERMLPAYLKHQDPAHRKLILDMAEEHGIETFAYQVEALANRPDAADALSRLNCPTLVLGATDDPLCPPSSQHDLLRQARRGTLVMIGDCGHFAPLERADEVSRALADWLRAQG